MAGEAEGPAVIFEIVAGFPLLLWSVLLWRGSLGDMDGRARGVLWLCAVALRLVLLDLEPAQSDDIYRYLWEGRVQLAGENPYRHAPNAPELSALRDDAWRLINHREHSAIYPPLAQWVFLLCAAISPTIVFMKFLFVLCDLGVLWVLLRWLARLGRSPAWAALWAFHPLVIVEFSGNGHLDSLMALMVVLALWNLEERREGAAVLALAGAVATKLVPLLILPYFFWRMKRGWLLGLVPLIVGVSYLPYAGAGEGLWRSLSVYERNWLYNAPMFEFARDTFFHADGFHARTGIYIALGCLAGILWACRLGPAAAFLPVVGFYQLAGPVVHPWYLAFFIPLVCVRRGAWPWMGLTILVPLVYWNEESTIVRAIVWAPFSLALGVQTARSAWTLRHQAASRGGPSQSA